jgi:putative nucleotidyltransferase with HDIG domain
VSAEALNAARVALAGRPAWLVGGAPRDRALGRDVLDVDVVIDGDTAEAARAVARAAGRAACFALSEEFGAWRVVARDHSWQVDVEPLRGGSLEADLALRDFTINAIAEPLSGGAPIDPLGGLADLDDRRLRMAGPGAFADDPLRVLRLVRIAIELDLRPEAATMAAARAHAGGLGEVSGERVFMELRRVLAAPLALHGLELMGEVGATAAVLPELEALRGVEQSRFHHRDVYGHTLEVLDRTIALQADPAASLDGGHGEASGPVEAADRRVAEVDPGEGAVNPGASDVAPGQDLAALLAEPLADGLTRGEALRWGALLHDAAKPLTRAVRPVDGRVTFIGHDIRGAELAQTVLGRLRTSERLRAHVAALVRHHLRAGFLVHEPQPLSRRTVFRYLRACSPVEADVTLLSVADRLATRGDRAQESIDAHLRVVQQLLSGALRWRADGPPAPLYRGDELADALAIGLGPRVGELLEELAEAQYAGEVLTREQALAYARSLSKTD